VSIFNPFDGLGDFSGLDDFAALLQGCACGLRVRTKPSADGKRMLCGNCRMKEALDLLRAKGRQ
jgi:hypothetical protein